MFSLLLLINTMLQRLIMSKNTIFKTCFISNLIGQNIPIPQNCFWLFSHGIHWIPEHIQKDLQYYYFIFTQTQFILVKLIFYKNNKTKMIYHSVYKLNLITNEKLGAYPHITKKIPDSDVTYCYYDYIEVSFKFMLFQNVEMSLLRGKNTPGPIWHPKPSLREGSHRKEEREKEMRG